MWTVQYILSQISVIFAAFILAASYLIKSKNKILHLTIFYSLFYAISYALIGAWIGVVLNFVSIIRNCWFLVEYRKKGSISAMALSSSLVMLITASVLSFVFVSFHPIDLLVLSETIVYTFSLWQKSNKSFRWLALYSSACWLTYNIFVYSLFAIILEAALLTAKIIGIVLLYIKKGKDKRKNVIEESKVE